MKVLKSNVFSQWNWFLALLFLAFSLSPGQGLSQGDGELVSDSISFIEEDTFEVRFKLIGELYSGMAFRTYQGEMLYQTFTNGELNEEVLQQDYDFNYNYIPYGFTFGFMHRLGPVFLGFSAGSYWYSNPRVSSDRLNLTSIGLFCEREWELTPNLNLPLRGGVNFEQFPELPMKTNSKLANLSLAIDVGPSFRLSKTVQLEPAFGFKYYLPLNIGTKPKTSEIYGYQINEVVSSVNHLFVPTFSIRLLLGFDKFSEELPESTTETLEERD